MLISLQADSKVLNEPSCLIFVNIFSLHRADHEGLAGPAPLTNGGTAMLVMRNFGYLGLHSAVFSKGSLARDRLVDFSGELQIRREETSDDHDEYKGSPRIAEGRTYVVSPWHKQFLSEPTVNGGRNSVEMKHARSDVDVVTRNSSEQVPSKTGANPGDKSRSKFYAQELAPVPLSLMPLAGKAVATPTNVRKQRSSRSAQADVEPAFHTTFCNELLCHPRLLYNAPKGNIAIKVEVRELEWSSLHQAYLARTPKFGPSLHNSRRGPFLVQESFTACSVKAVHAHFLDEFKIKLPLILEMRSAGGGIDSGPLALLFSVCSIDIKSKRSGKDRVEEGQSPSKDSRSNTPRKGLHVQPHFRLGPNVPETERKKSRLEVLACGFLPLTTGDTSCLIDNGLHDVKLMYTAEICSDEDLGDETLILKQIAEHKGRDSTFSFRTDSSGRSIGGGGDIDSLFQPIVTDVDGFFIGAVSATSETSTESGIPRSEKSSAVGRSRSLSRERMTLQVSQSSFFSQRLECLSLKISVSIFLFQVRIVVHSSVHPQNETLNEFHRQLPDLPTALNLSSDTPSSLWKLTRYELLNYFTTIDIGADNNNPSDKTQKLLQYTVDVSKASLCSAAESSAHFIRIFTQLMRTMVSGGGMPSLSWANPACAIPLRIHAFATLLQVISSVNTYMVRSGVTQLDGKGKWNLTLLGKVVAMVFDEGQLFIQPGEGTGEIFVLDDWKSMNGSLTAATSPERDFDSGSKPQHHRRREQMRSRQSRKADAKKKVGNDDPAAKDSLDEFRAEFAFISDSAVNADVSVNPLVPLSNGSPLDLAPTLSSEANQKKFSSLAIDAQANRTFVKIDTKSDFQSNLWAGSAESLLVSPSVSGSVAAQNMIQAYGGIGPSNRRKWMTAPSSGLATIHENADPVDSDLTENSSLAGLGPVVTQISPERSGDTMSSTSDDFNTSDSMDSELVRIVTGSSKKMRVPRIKKGGEMAEGCGSIDSGTSSSLTVPSTDEEIETAGTAFLDAIGKNLGYRYVLRFSKYFVRFSRLNYSWIKYRPVQGFRRRRTTSGSCAPSQNT